MKRIIMIGLMAAMLISLAIVSNAAPGDVYEPDGVYLKKVASLQPGQTYYVELSDTEVKRSRAKLEAEESYAVTTGRDITLVSSTTLTTVQKRQVSGGVRRYYAEMKLKAISLSSYDGEGYRLEADLTFTDESNKERSVHFKMPVAYKKGGKKITRDTLYFTFDDTIDEILELPYGSTFTIDSRGVKTKLLLSMNTDYDDAFGRKHEYANLTFYNGEQEGTLRRDAEVYIAADRNTYLYERKDGKLTDLTGNYKRNEDGFVFKTRTLGQYVLSNRRLDGATSSSSGSSGSSSSSPPTGGSGGQGSGSSAVSNLISTYFRNNFRVVNYGTVYENIGYQVTLVCTGLDFSGLNKSTLRVYVYDQGKNQLLYLGNATVGTDGNLTFKSSVKGYYVVTDSALTFR